LRRGSSPRLCRGGNHGAINEYFTPNGIMFEMKRKLSVSIIVPTINEEKNINLLISEISRAFKSYQLEIIVIDDNSTDKTAQIVKKIQKKKKNVFLYVRKKEKGLTSALNFGLSKTKGEIIGWLDADLSHPAHNFSKMIEEFPKQDVVVASRYLPEAKDVRNKFIQVLFSRLLNKICQMVLYTSFTDYTSGFILVKRKTFKNYKLTGDYGEYFIDMIAYFHRQKFNIKELPYHNIARIYGYSKTATNPIHLIIKGRKYLVMIFKNFFYKIIKSPYETS
jgi:dolichol-phosphate mannosyltransferase